MIILDSSKKIDIIYKNYIKQFSEAYIKGNYLYVGDSLNNASYIKKLYIEDYIKKYSEYFIKLYMNNNKIHNELYSDKLCIICLENLNGDIIDVCCKCNVKCHTKCVISWYKNNRKNVCPICLKSESYYLNNEEDEENNINIEIYNDNYGCINTIISTIYLILCICCICVILFSFFNFPHPF